MVSVERLLGRQAELERVRALLGHARNGRGAALLVTGEPGIGKTALLDATTSHPTGMRLLRVDGFEAESMIPFAAVQRLAMPLRGHLDDLPASHRHALRVAAGVEHGEPPDRFLVGLGVLGLLGAAGEDEPVLCVIDDAHLLDPESLDVLGLVARRLEAESVALVLAARDTVHVEERLAGVPGLPLAGLETEWALRLLSASLPESIDPAAATQVITATGGNPLALVDLAGELSVRRLTEVSLSDEPLPIGHHLEALYLRRIR
ncbi:MAG TPA: ATP-binding protein, partial [Nocardioides sp.]|nr:ATP-binding protein [Nocardioides sp.]